ncbi:MAG: LapA family protein [Pirellulaceae bacterium]|nr:LapA family protein [Pirellulaceae bacterium]
MIDLQTTDYVRPTNTTRPKRQVQFSLSTILLLIAAIASWLGYYKLRYDSAELQREIDAMRTLAQELIVSDVEMFAAVQRQAEWYGEDAWDVHIPATRPYEVKLATENIGLPQKAINTRSAPIDAGTRTLQLRTDNSGDDVVIRVLIDGQTAIEEHKPRSWQQSVGSSGHCVTQIFQRDPNVPLVLRETTYKIRRPDGDVITPEPARGIQFWIEPTVSSPPDHPTGSVAK